MPFRSFWATLYRAGICVLDNLRILIRGILERKVQKTLTTTKKMTVNKFKRILTSMQDHNFNISKYPWVKGGGEMENWIALLIEFISFLRSAKLQLKQSINRIQSIQRIQDKVNNNKLIQRIDGKHNIGIRVGTVHSGYIGTGTQEAAVIRKSLRKRQPKREMV